MIILLTLLMKALFFYHKVVVSKLTSLQVIIHKTTYLPSILFLLLFISS